MESASVEAQPVDEPLVEPTPVEDTPVKAPPSESTAVEEVSPPEEQKVPNSEP